MTAVDGDRGIKNGIKYAITGGPHHLFGINEDTGVVYSKVGLKIFWNGNKESCKKALIDRESEDARNGAFILEISAMEIVNTGGRGLSISTEVTVIIEVLKV